MEKTYGKMPKAFAEHPRDVFLRNIYINPFWEDSLEALIDVMTPEPHPVRIGLPPSRGLGRALRVGRRRCPPSTPTDDVRKIMGGNMFELLGLDVPA